MQGQQEAVPPVIPQWAQRLAQQGEKQDGTGQDAQHHVDPQLPLAKSHGKIEHRDQHRQAVKPVGEGGTSPFPQCAQGAQQVIQQPQKRSQQSSAQKCRRLGGNFNLHQPNRRLKNPPRL